MTTSPLLTADPSALTALFEADPLTLSDSDIMALILELRRRRNAFAAEEAAASLKPKGTRAKAPSLTPAEAVKADTPIGEISLDDL